MKNQTTPQDIAPLISLEEIKGLLSAKNHLADPIAASSDRSIRNPQDHRLFLRQRDAIVQAGKQRLVDLVPQLIAYLDYPSTSAVNPYSMPLEEIYGAEVRDSWPAFAAILEIGDEAIPQLEHYIRDDKRQLRLRLTALQVLQEMNAERAKIAGQALLQQIGKAEQKGAVDRIKLILDGKLRFWGIIDFAPITMSVAEITKLLASERHLKDIRIVLIKEETKNVPGAAANDRQADYELYLRQKEAIRNAGELGLESLVPNLILFIDYPRNLAAMQFSSILSLQVQSRRRARPALDAILKIGKAAVPQLERFIQSDKQELNLRLRALSTLKEIDAKRAEEMGQSLMEKFAKAENQDVVASIQRILSNRSNSFPKIQNERPKR